MRKLTLLAVGLLAGGMMGQAVAQTTGVTNSQVNLRSGPSSSYQVVAVLPQGQQVTVYGCLQDYTWCDAARNNDRGWIMAQYLNTYSNSSGSSQTFNTAAAVIGVGVVGFILADYWDDHYYDRPWYGRPPPPPPHGGGHRPPPPPPHGGGHNPPPPHGGGHPPPHGGGKPPPPGNNGGHHNGGPGGPPPGGAGHAPPQPRPLQRGDVPARPAMKNAAARKPVARPNRVARPPR